MGNGRQDRADFQCRAHWGLKGKGMRKKLHWSLRSTISSTTMGRGIVETGYL